MVATNTLPNLVRRRALLASTLGDAYNVVLTSTLPAGLKLLSATIAATGPIGRRRLAAPNSACTLAGRTATCTLGVVPAGGNATMVLQGKGLAAGRAKLRCVSGVADALQCCCMPPSVGNLAKQMLALRLPRLAPAACRRTACAAPAAASSL